MTEQQTAEKTLKTFSVHEEYIHFTEKNRYQFYSLLIQIYCGAARTRLKGALTCIKRMLRMRSWFSDYSTDAESRDGSDIPMTLRIFIA